MPTNKDTGQLPAKFMFTKQDQQFDEMAADPVRRREAIARLTTHRNRMFWLALFIMLLAFIEFWRQRSTGGGAQFAFVATMPLVGLLSLESKVRLLRVIDRLHTAHDDKAKDCKS
jgi:hypothetical protein